MVGSIEITEAHNHIVRSVSTIIILTGPAKMGQCYWPFFKLSSPIMFVTIVMNFSEVV